MQAAPDEVVPRPSGRASDLARTLGGDLLAGGMADVHPLDEHARGAESKGPFASRSDEQFDAFEVWDGARKVYVHPEPKSA